MKRFGSLFFGACIVLALVYVVYSLYGSRESAQPIQSVNNEVETQEQTSTLFAQTKQKEAQEERVSAQCSKVSLMLKSIYPSNAVFAEKHQAIIDSLILQNTGISKAISDQVAAYLGLQHVFPERNFTAHLRIPSTVDLTASSQANSISRRENLKLSLLLHRGEFDAARQYINTLLKNAPTKRFVSDGQFVLEQALGSHAVVKDNLNILDVFIDSGYKISLKEIVNAIAIGHSNELLFQFIASFDGNKNAIFDLKDGTKSSNLLLLSVKHGNLLLADGLLSQGFSFSSNIELQQALGSAFVEITDSLYLTYIASGQEVSNQDTNENDDFIFGVEDLSPAEREIELSAYLNEKSSLQNLLEAGVFLFEADQHALQDEQAHEKQAVDTQTDDKERNQIFKRLTLFFGQEEAERFLQQNTRTSLLSQNEQAVAKNISQAFVEKVKSALPESLQAQLTTCDVPLITSLQEMLIQHRSNQINTLYKPLMTVREEVDAILDGTSTRNLSQAQIEALDALPYYAAKAQLENVIDLNVIRKRSQVSRDQEIANSKEAKNFLESLFMSAIDDGIDRALEKLQATTLLNEQEKSLVSMQLAFYLGDDLRAFENALQSGSQADYYVLDTIISEDHADALNVLLKQGLALNKLEYNNKNMLFRALSARSKNIFDLLLANNIELKPITSQGFDSLDIALQIARQNSDFYYAEKLMAAGHEVAPSHIELLRDLAGKHYSKVLSLIEQFDIEIVDNASNSANTGSAANEQNPEITSPSSN